VTQPKVAYFAHSVAASGGGQERLGRRLLEMLSDEVEFTVVTSEGAEGLPESVRVHHAKLPARPAFLRIAMYAFRSRRIAQQLRRKGFLLHGCGCLSLARMDVVTIHLCHRAVPRDARDTLPLWRQWNAALARRVGLRLEDHSLRQLPQRVVAVSNQVAQEIASIYPGVTTRLVVIENGVDVQTPYREKPPFGSILKLVMVGSDFALKGVDDGLEIIRRTTNTELHVVGRGPVETYRSRARSLGIDSRVTFHGHVEATDIFQDMDVVLCLSKYESFGLFLVEAALRGCAVVGYNRGVMHELLSAGGGEIVSNIDEACRTIQRWQREPRTMSAQRHDLYSNALRFDESVMAHKYLNLYKELRACGHG
jgi:glycosyltransferase involved in cell wall biosynthesis